MKSRNSKKNKKYFRNQEDEIRIKERKKQPKKRINKNNYYLMLEEEYDDLPIDLDPYEAEEE